MQKIAEKAGCHQCLWLLGEDHEITEVGAMNIFVVMRSEDGGELELVTPPLDSGCILPGITRQSILELAREWGEFNVVERRITMKEVEWMPESLHKIWSKRKAFTDIHWLLKKGGPPLKCFWS